MFSFGSDKVISSVRGGAVTTDNDGLAQKLREYQSGLQHLSFWKIWQHLNSLHFFSIGKRLYSLFVGKAMLFIAKKLGIINKIVYKEEKRGKMSAWTPAKFPNALAQLAFFQLKRLDKKNEHRKRIAILYNDEIDNKNLVKPAYNPATLYLRYPLLTEQPEKLHAFAKKNGIILGDWYNQVIAPKDVDLEKTGYRVGECPNAEKLASQSINLPTNVSLKQAKKVVKVVNMYKSVEMN